MAKKPAPKKSTAKPQPEPAQLKAIERLLESRDDAEAVRRIRSLLARFPDQGGLHRSLVLALERAEGPQAAAVAAFAWAERHPNSLPAQEALLAALSAGRRGGPSDRAWMAGTGPAMTGVGVATAVRCQRRHHPNRQTRRASPLFQRQPGIGRSC